MRTILTLTCLLMAGGALVCGLPCVFIIAGMCAMGLIFEARPHSDLKRDYDNRVRR